MEVIDEKELKTRLDRGERLTPVMFMDRVAFERAHLRGPLQCTGVKEAAERFPKDEPIGGYCSIDARPYSNQVCAALVEHGYTRIIQGS